MKKRPTFSYNLPYENYILYIMKKSPVMKLRIYFVKICNEYQNYFPNAVNTSIAKKHQAKLNDLIHLDLNSRTR